MGNRLWRYRLLGLIALCVWAGWAAPCRAQETFKTDEISRFDGKTWGGLTLGESSTADIKRLFKTSKGAVRPEAMLLPQPDNAPVRVDVLMNGRGAKSVLNGFRLAYTEGGVDLKVLADTLKIEPETWYPREHFDDWRIVAFPERGIVTFVEGSGRVERVALVLLCAPFHVKDAVGECEHQPAPPRNIRDVFPDDKRVVGIGQVQVSINCDKTIKMDKPDDVARGLEDHIRRLRTPREIDIRSGGTGRLTVKLDLAYSAKDNKATVTANADMQGTTLLGRVAAAGQSADTYREDNPAPVWSGPAKLEHTFYDALDKAWAQMADKVRRQPLPTPAALRVRAWDAMIDLATKTAPAAH